MCKIKNGAIFEEHLVLVEIIRSSFKASIDAQEKPSVYAESSSFGTHFSSP
jgi:hypothetical protein